MRLNLDAPPGAGCGSWLNGKSEATSSRLQPDDGAPDAKLADGSWLLGQLRQLPVDS